MASALSNKESRRDCENVTLVVVVRKLRSLRHEAEEGISAIQGSLDSLASMIMSKFFTNGRLISVFCQREYVEVIKCLALESFMIVCVFLGL